ncbi:hypothetical protein TNCV_4955821 [Trichonephila clavipes]|nr:hypothetical protein TNCV_4955821 [Trichonephila clavipes]
MRTINSHITWGRKPRLADQNCDNSSRPEDDEPDKIILPKLLQGSTRHSASECVAHIPLCTSTFFDYCA